ncbi:MAG: hypothetical protein KAQ63_01185 [Candidatus Moranbacteria bacterium]|nr:hypothetical protein [Candidatus Moranbacteria bacterium]
MEDRKKKILLTILVLAAIGSGLLWGWRKNLEIKQKEKEEAQVIQEKLANKKALEESLQKAVASISKNTELAIDEIIPPPPPSMNRMKIQGCVVDGFLNGQTDDAKSAIDLINRSGCYYLHRSIETWLEAPDFEEIEDNIKKITKEDVVYGMFIAEAIDTKAEYFSKTKERELDFSKMCKSDSKNFWGEHTCIPSLKRSEYQNYVFDMATRAIDLGVQSFMFGQIHYQDEVSQFYAEDLIEKIRDYAEFRGVEIVIGAQTNDIDDKKYLRAFDFIEGGVGIDSDGKVEEGPCFSRWWKKKGDWCWALLWHDDFRERANNVLVHLDWGGVIGDDMSIFAKMSQEKRAETLKYLDGYFASRDVGFLMPMLAVLPKENEGCHGNSRKFYSADNEYSCKDEDVINRLLEN